MLLIGAGGGLSFPALMALAMTGATAEDSGPALRPRQHDPAGRRRRSAWRCSRRWRRRAATACSASGDSQAAALTGGYTLAFGVAVGFLVAAFAIAVVVLRRPRAEAERVPADAELAYEEAA